MLKRIANIVAVAATIAVNALANILPLNGRATGDIADSVNVMIQPAGYVFGIWSLIYLGLVAFAIFQALPSQRSNPRLERVGWWFVISCAANIGWLFLWHYGQLALSLAAMLVLLGSLIEVYRRLEIGRSDVGAAERWTVRAPFSIYLGWISVATIVNAAVTLTVLGWNGFGIGAEGWTIIMLAVAVALAALVKRARGDNLYLLVLAWAFAGIALRNAALLPVSIAAWIAAALVLLLLLVRTRGAVGGVRLATS